MKIAAVWPKVDGVIDIELLNSTQQLTNLYLVKYFLPTR
jgi:hypothetical protein